MKNAFFALNPEWAKNRAADQNSSFNIHPKRATRDFYLAILSLFFPQ